MTLYSPCLNKNDGVLQTEFIEYGLDKTFLRGVPVKYLDTVNGKIPVATIYDLLMGQYGVDRGLEGDYPKDYTDKDASYTPAWQEIFTGIDSKTVIQFAHEWGNTAETTKGKVHGNCWCRYQPLVSCQFNLPLCSNDACTYRLFW